MPINTVFMQRIQSIQMACEERMKTLFVQAHGCVCHASRQGQARTI
jgi:hypothetical protein